MNAISIDNWTFKLFYKATTTLCLACSVVASSKQFFGDPINCEVVSTYCSRTRCRDGWPIRILHLMYYCDLEYSVCALFSQYKTYRARKYGLYVVW